MFKPWYILSVQYHLGGIANEIRIASMTMYLIMYLIPVSFTK